MIKVIQDELGIEHGHMTTVHSYTNDQNLVDANHKDLRRARAGAVSIIPTSTGATNMVGVIFPDLQGKVAGTAVRVPTANVSMVDFTFVAKRNTSVTELNNMFLQASKDSMKGIIGYSDEELVSVDFVCDPNSAIFDSTTTNVVNNRLCRIAAWYDNEYGFSCRMLNIIDRLIWHRN